ncbi:MAG: hypothetical protein AAGK04_10420, partial [Planctomycetota bacterium]
MSLRASARFWTLLAMGSAASHAKAEAPGILSIAPDTAWLVLHAPDASVFLDPDPESSTLGRLLADDDVRAFLDDRFNDAREMIEERAELLELDPDDLPLPTGSLGLALIDRGGRESWAIDDASVQDVLMWADFGDDVDEATEALDRIIDRAIEDDGAEFEESEIDGIELVTLIQPGPSKDELAELEPW